MAYHQLFLCDNNSYFGQRLLPSLPAERKKTQKLANPPNKGDT